MIVKDYYFKKELRPIIQQDIETLDNFSDFKDHQPVIRIVGTQDEIDELAYMYIELHDLQCYLDEVYTYEVPKKGTSWYKHPCFGTPEQYNEKMKKIQSNINTYKQKYEEIGAFIV